MNKNELPKRKESIYGRYIKRILDVIISGISIVVLSPLLLILMLIGLIVHGRPIFYRQERPGLNEEIFQLYKFRSMTDEKDSDGKLLPGKDRITPYGKFLRRTSLDELPELFCIFAGKMSIIGPRPLLVKYLPLYTERHRMRHSVRPGLACEPIKPLKTWTWNDQFETDIYYIEHLSFMTDLKTLFAVLKAAVRGSEYRSSDMREEYNKDNLYIDANKSEMN